MHNTAPYIAWQFLLFSFWIALHLHKCHPDAHITAVSFLKIIMCCDLRRRSLPSRALLAFEKEHLKIDPQVSIMELDSVQEAQSFSV